MQIFDRNGVELTTRALGSSLRRGDRPICYAEARCAIFRESPVSDWAHALHDGEWIENDGIKSLVVIAWEKFDGGLSRPELMLVPSNWRELFSVKA